MRNWKRAEGCRREHLRREDIISVDYAESKARVLTAAQISPVDVCEPGQCLELCERWPRRRIDEHADGDKSALRRQRTQGGALTSASSRRLLSMRFRKSGRSNGPADLPCQPTYQMREAARTNPPLNDLVIRIGDFLGEERSLAVEQLKVEPLTRLAADLGRARTSYKTTPHDQMSTSAPYALSLSLRLALAAPDPNAPPSSSSSSAS